MKYLKKSAHYGACPYPAVYDALRSIKAAQTGDTVKLAMKFIILNASRAGEVRLAMKSEIDFVGQKWTIPPS